jgi:hypothetical protein
LDRVYNDYSLFLRWTEAGINYVCRAKDNMAYEVVVERPVPNRVGRPSAPGREEPVRSHVISDQIIRLTGRKAREDHPGTLRRVTVWIEEEPGSRNKSREMVFLTNNLTLSPVTIAQIYKQRWSIEAFFKLIKQNLKIKSFMGTSASALKIQVYAALITYILIKYLQALSSAGWSTCNILMIMRLSLYLNLDLMYFLNRERPTVPRKPGLPPPVRRGVQHNRLF